MSYPIGNLSQKKEPVNGKASMRAVPTSSKFTVDWHMEPAPLTVVRGNDEKKPPASSPFTREKKDEEPQQLAGGGFEAPKEHVFLAGVI